MSFVRKTFKGAAVGVAVADDPAGLRAFLQPGCAAAIWRRNMPKDVQSWLESVPEDALPNGRVILPKGAVAETVGHLCDMSAMPNGGERAWLEADIAEMARMFADLMQTDYLRLRLDRIQTNACRRFHIDAVTARLVCTYRGTGTQYGVSTDGAEPKRVFTVPTGAPILLRGTLWPAEPPSGLLHRSPPIEGTGETRLVLVVDPILDPDEAE
ncbi:DUF1826 domain-containing protein [Ruegeria sp. THAF33]|uniref:DUF1826 domain-containing protein n=1 Tax=Ruegeria sp. THAF33 TaxID=2587853 RepID=UPI0012678FCC|nr:DUF1826 domain-containing protein [Ruegeria sp. THAF33]QFT72548.1 hypothetical protein FIU92_05875 [Ruegeria sp. THAF33]